MLLNRKINYQKLHVTGENEIILYTKFEFMRASVRMHNRLVCKYFLVVHYDQEFANISTIIYCQRIIE